MKARLPRSSWFVCLLAAAGLTLASAQQNVTVPLEGDLVLLPDQSSVKEPITGILWKHGPNKVAEWDKGFGPDVDYYGTYKDRTALNKQTGKLIIKNVNEDDSGEYSVDVNGRLQSKTYKVVTIPKPVGPIVGGIVGGIVGVLFLVGVGVGLYLKKKSGRK